MGKTTKASFNLQQLKDKYNLDDIETVDNKGVPIVYYSVVKEGEMGAAKDEQGTTFFKRIGQPYKLTFYKNTYYSKKLGGTKKVKDAAGENLGSIEFGKEYFQGVLTKITELIESSKANFTEVFQEFNGFKTSVYTYFQDPSTSSSTAALNSYKQMKTKVNKRRVDFCS